jgi:hypothetical protein
MYELVKYCMSLNCFLSLSFRVQGVYTVHKECVDIGLTLGKLRRDIVEPSSVEVKGVHRKDSVLGL